MKRRDIFDLVLLAALWGASFLFTRMAVPAFGALAIAELRVAVAALVLLPLLALRGDLSALRVRPLRFVLLGAVNTAIPFALFAWAVLSITAGLAAILNATAPLFTALVAWFWLRERLTALQWIGMAIGFAGVLWLTGARVGFGGGAVIGRSQPHLQRRSATASRRTLQSATSATCGRSLSPPAARPRPRRCCCRLRSPRGPMSCLVLRDWGAAIALGVLCTGIAYILYFRLIARVGPATAITVTFLIPAFAMLWGGLFLGEAVSATMLVGCAIILVGTALASGWLRLPQSAGTRSTT